MAHVKKLPSKRWQARFRAPDGRERARNFDRKADAERWLARQVADRDRGAWIDPSAGRVTFRDFAEEWRTIQLHRSGTSRSAEQQLRLHVYPRIGDRPLAGIRPSDIQALVHRLDAGLAPSTTQVVYGRVVAVFRAAVRDRLIAASPCVGVRLPEKDLASMLEVLTSAHVHALAGAVPARYRNLVLAGAGTGLRPGELFGLALDRVDFLRRTLRVDQQLVRVPGGVALAPLKTKASYRTLPLPDVVASALAAHLSEWPAHPGLGVIFTNVRGCPHPGLPVRRAVERFRPPGRPPGMGHASRSAPLLRQRPDPRRGIGEGHPGPPGPRLGQDIARHLRAPLPRRGGPHEARDRRRSQDSCGQPAEGRESPAVTTQPSAAPGPIIR